MYKHLKKKTMLLFVAASMMTLSCSKNPEGTTNNENNNISSNQILGKWTVSSIAGNSQAEAVGMTWEYKSNGDLSIEANGNILNGTYVMNDKELVMSYASTIETVTVKEISQSTMVWDAEILLGEPVPGEIVLNKQ